MRLQNTQLHDIAANYYFKEYLQLLQERQNRKLQAYMNYMNGYVLPNKLLESDIKQNLQSESLPSLTRSRLENILQSGNYISDNDVNLQNYKNAQQHRLSFNWPDGNEITLRSSEEANFASFITANPRTEITRQTTRNENSEFAVLISSS